MPTMIALMSNDHHHNKNMQSQSNAEHVQVQDYFSLKFPRNHDETQQRHNIAIYCLFQQISPLNSNIPTCVYT